MEKNLFKTDSIRELGKFDLRQLLEKVNFLSESDWNLEEDFKLNYNKSGKALSQVKHLTLRFINRQKEPYEYLESTRWEEWKSLLLPLMKQIVAPFEYKQAVFPKVMLANLAAGSFIPPHIDGGKQGYVPHKIHLPILTNNQSFFFLEDKKFHFEIAKAYEVNNGLRHAVVNNGSTNRIHLIFECLDFEIQPKSIQLNMERIR